MAIAITSFTPSGGPTTGGTKVVITGTGLDTVDDVLFGEVPAEVDTTATNTSTSLTVLAPPIPNDGTLVVKITLIDLASTGVLTESSTSFTYATVSTPQLTSTTAGKWKLDVDSSVGKDGSAYIPVRGMTNFQPTVNFTTQDDSDYDTEEWGSDAKTQMKWQNTCKVSRKRAAGYVEDPGQKVLRLAHDQLGDAGSVRVRWYDRNGGDAEAFEGFALVQWSDDGGATSDLSTVSVTLMGQGARTPIDNPA